MNMWEFSKFNRTRCESPQGFNHPLAKWSASDWGVAVSGELGEVAQALFYMERVEGQKHDLNLLRQGIRNLSDEIADVYCYLDLMAQFEGWILPDLVHEHSRRLASEITAVGALAKAKGWTPGDYLIPVQSAIGGIMNIVKKRNRIRDGIVGSRNTSDRQLTIDLRESFARSAVYLDIFCAQCGLFMPRVVLTKFNAVSVKIGYAPAISTLENAPAVPITNHPVTR